MGMNTNIQIVLSYSCGKCLVPFFDNQFMRQTRSPRGLSTLAESPKPSILPNLSQKTAAKS